MPRLSVTELLRCPPKKPQTGLLNRIDALIGANSGRPKQGNTFSITLAGAQYHVLCVLCGEDGIQCQTLPIDFAYKKLGFWNGIKRFFGVSSGWGTENIYDDVEYVNVDKLIQDKVGGILNIYEKEFNEKLKDADYAIEKIKEKTKEKLIKADKVISDTLTAIDKKTKDEETLKQKVEENKENLEWVQSFIEKVEKILEV